MWTRPCSERAAYSRRVPSTEPPKPVASMPAVTEPARWPWLKRVVTLSVWILSQELGGRYAGRHTPSLETRDTRPDRFDGAGTITARNNAFLYGERVFALAD
jgi:hypothetical protein